MEQPHNVGDYVRKAERDFIRGTTRISKYVNHSMNETLERIDAYMNSVHISGQFDALNREKPFFNICVAAVNTWYRATDIDRSNIKVSATASHDWTKSLFATYLLQDWMKREGFGSFLNEWGRTLARYGSAVTKTIKNKNGLSITVVPWSRLIVDPVDFENNPVIEVIELSESELIQRINTHGYDRQQVKALIDAHQVVRRTKDLQNKDNRAYYYRLYEVHALWEKSKLTGQEPDDETLEEFVQQMHVISFVGNRNGREVAFEDFTLIKGEEDRNPYRITHLIKEDNRTLSRGAVESLFDAQWMQNHTVKQMKDQLDMASKLVFQTADQNFVGRNVITDIETGDIFINAPNTQLTKVDNSGHDLTGLQSYAVMWKQLGNEITGVSDAMLGAAPKAGTAWRQTEAMLAENHSLFELMTENKGLALEQMLREDVIPYLKRKLVGNKEQIRAILDRQNLQQVDAAFVPVEAVRRYNERTKQHVVDFIMGNTQEPPQQFNPQTEQQAVQEDLTKLGNTRFFTPDELGNIDWATALKDLEWELDIDITGEMQNRAEALQTLNTALQVIMNPMYAQSKQAQMVVGKILEQTGVMSPLEVSSLPIPTPMQPASLDGSSGQLQPKQ